MGDVWEATNVVTGRAVAIKRLRLAPGATAGDMGRARFALEARTACAVEHPNVVEILDFVEAGDEPPIIVMELLRGETLGARIEREPSLSTEAVATLLLPVVSAVGTAHARGIVHRDLKPANIFLQTSGERTVVKVLDFGIAKWVGARPSDMPLRTETGSTLGTPCYMAPEQAMGERVIDHRADVWALGVILYECLSGMRPVEGENAAKIMVRLLSTGIMPLDKLVPGVPPALAALVMRMLSREPAQRPPSLGEVQRVLGALTSASAPDFGEPQVELAAPGESFTLPPGKTTAPLTRSVATDRPERARRVPLGLALGVGGVALVAFAAFALSRGAARDAEHAAQGEPRKLAPAELTAPAAPAAPALAATPAAIPSATSPAPTTSALPTGPSSKSVGLVASDATHPTLARPKRSPAGAVAPEGTKPSTAAAEATAGLAAGSACERSRDCASRLCLAFVCK